MSKIVLKNNDESDKLVRMNAIVSKTNSSLKLKRLTIEEATNIAAASNNGITINNKKTSSIFLRRERVFFTFEFGTKRSIININFFKISNLVNC